MTTRKNIIWTLTHMKSLASATAPLILAGTKPLPALRAAQEKVLDPSLHRDLVSWTTVREELKQMIEAECAMLLRPRLRDANQQSVEPTSNDVTACAPQECSPVDALLAKDPQAAPPIAVAAVAASEVGSIESARVSDAEGGGPVTDTSLSSAAPTTPTTILLEAALVVALQSPQVERALITLFSTALAKATALVTASPQAGAQATAPAQPPASAPRVLIAGFPPKVTERLNEIVSPHHDVRTWRTNQPAQIMETLLGICSIAIVPEGCPEDIEDHIKGKGVRLVEASHDCAADRLLDRLVA